MEWRAKLEKHSWWIGMLISLIGASSFFSWAYSLISRDALIAIIFILFFVSVIINFALQHKRETTKSDCSKAEAKSTKIEDESHIDVIDKDEVSQWVEMCEKLKNWLTPAINDWKMMKKRGTRGTVTKDVGMTMMNQRKLDYDKAIQMLNDYRDKNYKN